MKKILPIPIILFLFSIFTLNAAESVVKDSEIRYFSKKENVTIQNSATFIKEQLSIGKNFELRIKSYERDNLNIDHIKYEQDFENIKIEGAAYYLHDDHKPFFKGNGLLLKELNINTRASISENQALNFAKKEIAHDKYFWETESGKRIALEYFNDEKYFFPKGELVIISPEIFKEVQKNHLAYKFDILAANGYERSIIYIDAHSGEILIHFQDSHSINTPARGITRNGDTVSFYSDHFNQGFRLRENQEGCEIITMDAQNLSPGNENPVDLTDYDNFWNNFNERLDNVGVDLHWGTERTYFYYKEKHDRFSIDDKGHKMLSFIHVGKNWANASWNGSFMSYGDGYNNPFTDIAIVAHELTHGVTQHTAGLIYSYESGALNESFSDMIGVSVKYYGGHRTNDGKMVWNIVSRNLADPNSSGQPDTYLGNYWHTASSDMGGVHTNSQVANYWFYLICEGGTGTNDNGENYSVNSIGLEKAEQIAYRTLVYYLTPSSGYYEMRNLSLQATADLYGQCSDEYKQVANAWYAVGVGGSDITFDIGITDILSPRTSCQFLDNEIFEIELAYFGDCENIPVGTNIPIHFTINDTDIQTENIKLNKALSAEDKITLILQRKIDFSEEKSKNIKIWHSYSKDKNFTNDTLELFVVSGYQNGKDYDIQLSELISPTSSCEVLTDNETVQFVIKNNSCNPISKDENIPYKISLNSKDYSGNIQLENDLESKESITISLTEKFDFSQNNKHTFSLSVNHPQDEVKANNSLDFEIYSGSHSQFPYVESFEEGNGAWYSESVRGYNDWQWGSPGTELISEASDGSKCWATKLKTLYSHSSEYSLYTPCFNFSALNSPKLSFDLIFDTEESYDGLVVEYSIDGGEWTNIKTLDYNMNYASTVIIGLPWFSGTNNAWKNYSTIIPELAGKSGVQFRFHFASDTYKNGEGFAVDNFRIENFEYNDIELVKVLKPSSSCSLGEEEYISVLLKNRGNDSVLDFELKLKDIYHTKEYIENVVDTVFSGREFIYEFKNSVDLSRIGRNYTFNIEVINEGDQNPTNNKIEKHVISNPTQLIPPFKDDFESKNLEQWNLVTAPNTISWKVSDAETENQGLSGRYWEIPEHGNFLLVNDLNNLSVKKNDYIWTKSMDFTSMTSASARFELFFTSVFASEAYFVTSIDGGKTVDKKIKLSPDLKWQSINIDLSEYLGMSCLAFGFNFNDKNVNKTGMAIDNFQISEKPDYDLEAVSVYPIDEFSRFDNQLKLKIKNLGKEHIEKTDITVRIQSNGNDIELNRLIKIDLDSGEEGEYLLTFSDYEENIKGFTLEVKYPYDEVPANNITDLFLYNYKIEKDKEDYIQSFDEFSTIDNIDLSEGWNNSIFDETEWIANKNTTATSYTGPKNDHSGTGIYLYVEATNNFGKSASLISPEIHIDFANPYLNFWYHMYGRDGEMGTLTVDVFDGDQWHNDVWSISDNQGQSWNEAMIPLFNYVNEAMPTPFIKIRFRGIVGTSQYSDIAIDDIAVIDREREISLNLLGTLENTANSSVKRNISFEIENLSTERVKLKKVTVNVNGTDYIKEFTGAVTQIEISDKYEFTTEEKVQLHPNQNTISYKVEYTDQNEANTYFENSGNKQFLCYDRIFNVEEITRCEGIDVFINASGIHDFNSFQWLDMPAENDMTIYSDTSGIFAARYIFSDGQILDDTLKVNILPAPKTTLADMQIENGEYVDPGEFVSYLWHDNSTNRTFYIDKSGEYFVTVSDDNGCFGTDAFFADVITGVKDSDKNSQISIFPNPTQDYININIENYSEENMQLRILDIRGNILIQKSLGSDLYIQSKSDLSKLAKGFYIIELRTKTYIKTQKLIVE